MTDERRVDHLACAEALIVEAGAVTGKARAATAEQRRRNGRGRRGIADAHLAQDNEIGFGRESVVAGRHGVEELGLVHGVA
jgi:hypothetical protein